jgi:hypothetical protein
VRLKVLNIVDSRVMIIIINRYITDDLLRHNSREKN